MPRIKISLRFTLILLFSSFLSQLSAQAFVTKWATYLPGTSNANQITIPVGAVGSFNYNVDWGDGLSSSNVNGPITHTYLEEGVYTVSITGDFPSIAFMNQGDKEKILEVLEWGDIAWESFEEGFHGCTNLTGISTVPPNLSNITSMRNMFRGAINIQGLFADWDISKVTDMQGMFSGVNLGEKFYDNMLLKWSDLNTLEKLIFNAGESQYCKASEARDKLINEKKWTIVDDGQFCVEPFIIRVKVEAAFGNRVNILTDRNLEYNFNIDWGDGVTEEGLESSRTRIYQEEGIYDISISGKFPKAIFSSTEFYENLLEVKQWGSLNWEDFTNSFAGCRNLKITAEDTPFLADVRSLEGMFTNAKNVAFYPSTVNFREWDISKIEDMSRMFEGVKLDTFDYTEMIDAWASQAVKLGVEFDGGGSVYRVCGASNERIRLISESNWQIQDGGETAGDDCNSPNFSESFVSIWDTRLIGEQSQDNCDRCIRLHLSTTNDAIVDWGDGTFETLLDDILHVYEEPGIYQVRILAKQLAFDFNNRGDKEKLLSIEDWGMGAWTSFKHAFDGCTNLVVNTNKVPSTAYLNDQGEVVFVDDIDGSFGFRNCKSLCANDSVKQVLKLPFANTESMFEGACLTTGMEDISSIVEVIYRNISMDSYNAMFKNVEGEFSPFGTFYIKDDDKYIDFLSGVKLSTASYDDLLKLLEESGGGLGQPDIPINVQFDAGLSQYCESEEEHLTLTNDYGWIINDGGKNCDLSRPLVTRWNTGNSGFTDRFSIRIPSSGQGFNYDIYWGDGTVDKGVTSLIEHQYAEEGEYTISIYGDFPRFSFDKDNDGNKLIEISSWGDVVFDSFEEAFSSCPNLQIVARDSIKTQGLISLREGFKGVKYVGGSVGLMDVSEVLDMSYAFQGVSEMPASLAGWDVSQVENMEGMFLDNTTFNGNIGAWNVKNVTNMRSMFDGAESFNQNLGSWNVSEVTNFSRMLEGTNLSLQNYDNLLIGWNKLPSLKPNQLFSAGRSQYCRGGTARAEIASNNNWTIQDFGEVFQCCAGKSTEFNFGSWTYGPPDGSSTVILNTDYNTSIEMLGINACDVMVNEGKVVEITDGYFLNVEKLLDVKGNLLLKGGSFDFGN